LIVDGYISNQILQLFKDIGAYQTVSFANESLSTRTP